MMTNYKSSGFITSSKILRYKLGHKAADVLDTLLYKMHHWKSKGRLVNHHGYDCFYISYSDIEEETTFSESVIAKNVQILKKAGLIKTFQQGMTKPNLYFVDESAINKYEAKYKDDYDNWRLKIRSKKGASSTEFVGGLKNNQTGIVKMMVQEPLKQPVTNNKNTNNKNTKLTIQTSSVGLEFLSNDLWYKKECELEVLIEDWNFISDENERVIGIIEVFNFLKGLIPDFIHYSMSEKDVQMINEVLNHKTYSSLIAAKIISNALSILNKKKAAKFYNLFSGLRELNDNVVSKYGN